MGLKLSGVLYLHRITDVRMAGTPLRNLAVFKDLCGDENLKNIVLVTTMWDELQDESIGSKREEALLSTFWKDMVHLGSRTCRFQGTRESVWEIVNCLDLGGSFQARMILQIQHEIVDCGLPLHETAAARTLFRSLSAEFRKMWARMRHSARGKADARRPSEDRRRHVFSRPSTIGSSGSSLGTASVSDSGYSSGSVSFAFSDSTGPSGPSSNSNTSDPTGGITPGCSAYGRRETLSAMIIGLRLAHQMADIASIPILRRAIGTVLQIAQMIEASSRSSILEHRA